jgi:hypothetical protein
MLSRLDVVLWLVAALLLSGYGCTRPELVVRPDLADLYYCGTNPFKPSTIPQIPPLGKQHEDVELIQVQAFIRHGDRMFWGGVTSPEYGVIGHSTELIFFVLRSGLCSVGNRARILR